MATTRKTLKHSWLCKLVMAFARRRVCTCGKSKSRTKQQTINQWVRRHEKRAREARRA